MIDVQKARPIECIQCDAFGDKYVLGSQHHYVCHKAIRHLQIHSEDSGDENTQRKIYRLHKV